MATKFDGGVRFYTQMTLKTQVYFPENDVICQNCKFLKADYLLKRCLCSVTSEIIPDPEYMVGGMCPLMFANPVDSENLEVIEK